MTQFPPVVSRERRLAARRELWLAERVATHARDVLNARRRALPVVAVDKRYALDGPRGEAGLLAPGQDYHVHGEQPGASMLLRDGARVFRSYSSYGRGLDLLLTTCNYLELAPFGCCED